VVNTVGVHTHTLTSPSPAWLASEEYGEAHGGWTACHEGHSHIHDGAEVWAWEGKNAAI
jgi:hypothetical protein